MKRYGLLTGKRPTRVVANRPLGKLRTMKRGVGKADDGGIPPTGVIPNQRVLINQLAVQYGCEIQRGLFVQ